MKAGDTKQAILLSIVAVAAIGFLVFRLLPRHGSFFPLVASNRAPGQTTASAAAELPLHLLGNPFSHPKLAVVDPARPAPNEPPASDINMTGVMPLMPVGNLPDAQLGAVGPEETAGLSRQQEQEPRIALKAVVRVDEPLALMSVENQKAELHKPGDELAPNVKLLSIGDSFVTLSIFGSKRRMQVGDSLGTPEKH